MVPESAVPVPPSTDSAAPAAVHVVGAVIVRGHRVFAARRAPQKSFPGCWEFPGGKVEHAEEPEQALARELHEELGTTVRIGELMHRSTFGADVRPLPIDLACYWAQLDGPEPVAGEDHDQLGWFTADELASLDVSPADEPARELAVAFLRGHPA